MNKLSIVVEQKEAVASDIDLQVKEETDKTYEEILLKAGKINFDKESDYYLFVNAELRKELEISTREIVKFRRNLRKDRRGVGQQRVDEDILLEVIRGIKQERVGIHFGISAGGVNQAIKRAVIKIVGKVDPSLKPKDLIRANLAKIERYFIINRNKRVVVKNQE